MSKELRERMTTMLNDTAAFFNSNNRGYDEIEGTCAYIVKGKNDTEQCCAIGRLLPDEHKEFVRNHESCNNEQVDQLFRTFEETNLSIPPVFAGIDIDFLCALQSTHDANLFWNNEGITEDGKARVKRIQTYINEGSYDNFE